MAIIIPALDTGFKMCQWRVIVTVIDVIFPSQFFFFFFLQHLHLICCFIDHRNAFMEIHGLCFCPRKHLFSLLFPSSIFLTQKSPLQHVIISQTS